MPLVSRQWQLAAMKQSEARFMMELVDRVVTIIISG